MPIDFKTQVLDNVKQLKKRLDVPCTPDYVTRRLYAKFLDMYNHNPTIGAIAEHQYLMNPKHVRYQKYYDNIDMYEASPEVRYLREVIEEQQRSLYPKTRHIRDYIIRSGRMDLSKVTRSRGYTWLDKLKIFLRK